MKANERGKRWCRHAPQRDCERKEGRHSGNQQHMMQHPGGE
jgi:hypothetical protein